VSERAKRRLSPDGDHVDLVATISFSGIGAAVRKAYRPTDSKTDFGRIRERRVVHERMC